jgi:hypothetical protein
MHPLSKISPLSGQWPRYLSAFTNLIKRNNEQAWPSQQLTAQFHERRKRYPLLAQQRAIQSTNCITLDMNLTKYPLDENLSRREKKSY